MASNQLGKLEFAIAEISDEKLSELLDDIAEIIELRGFECTGKLWFENIDDLEAEVEALLNNKGEGNENGKEVRSAETRESKIR